jgi:precorrin-3B C17-methyltransferase
MNSTTPEAGSISSAERSDKQRTGKLYVVGIGPGGRPHRTFRACEAIAESRVVVGYTPYLDSIADLTEGKELIASGMTFEVERCREALRRAAEGEVVALISSGDAGIYGMAGLALELAHADGLAVPVEIVPGVTAASAAAAALGAPLMLDFAVISLSDLMVSWESIRRRLEAVAASDFVVALYNPRSKKRTGPLDEAVAILRAARPGQTPVGIVTAAGQADESLVVTDLDHLLEQKVDMRTVVIVGNSRTRQIDGRLVTARGYLDRATAE